MGRAIGLGAGGHARVILSMLRCQAGVQVVGLLDPAKVGQSLDGFPILGGDDLLGELSRKGVSMAFVGVGGLADNATRKALYGKIKAAGLQVLTIVHPAAVVESTVTLGEGVVIMAGAIVNAGASLGHNVVINTGAIVEHDCRIEAHAQVGPGAILCGGVQVGAEAFVGAGAVVRQSRRIGKGALVGAGAVVVKDVPPGVTVVGIPAEPMSSARFISPS